MLNCSGEENATSFPTRFRSSSIRFGGSGTRLTFPLFVWARDPVEALQWSVAARALALGVDVVLDFGLWTRAEREDFRARATALGARSELRFPDVSLEELLRRLAERNASLLPDTFHVTEVQIHEWWDRFEAPTADELAPREVP